MRRIGICVLVLLSGCAFSPGRVDESVLRAQGESWHRNDVRISTAVVSDQQAREFFGVGLGSHGIQAIWVEVENRAPTPFYYLPVSTDSEYFSPLEVAWKVRGGHSKSGKQAISRQFYAAAMPVEIPPGETVSGFVFTNRDLGMKVVNITLLGQSQSWYASFLHDVPGIKLDVEKVNLDQLYAEHETRNLTPEQLRQWVAEQPCCTRNEEGSAQGDPVNFVIVGPPELLLNAFAQRGWDLTERIHGGSIWKTMKSFMLGSSYRYSPVSSLYFMQRPQDLAMQKARGNIHQRNHLRLWRAPVDMNGSSVWMGQISRDIGVRFTTRSPTLTTHKIDPDVDEARDYLLQDMILSQRLEAFGYVHAMPARPLAAPGHNLTGDPYVTDGLRLMMFFHQPLTAADRVRNMGWDSPDRDRRAMLEQMDAQATAAH